MDQYPLVFRNHVYHNTKGVSWSKKIKNINFHGHLNKLPKETSLRKALGQCNKKGCCVETPWLWSFKAGLANIERVIDLQTQHLPFNRRTLPRTGATGFN